MTVRSFRATVYSLALGQLLSWAFLYFAFSSFVLPMRQSLGWSEPELMGAFTLGLGVWGLASYGVGAAIDRGRGRAVMTLGGVLGGAGFLLWSGVETLPVLYAAWALIGASMAMLLYEPAFAILAKRYPRDYRGGITTLTLFGGFGSTLSFTLVAWLIARHDWRTALLLIALIQLMFVAPLHAWALRGRPNADPPPGGASSPRGTDSAGEATLREALRGASFWLLTAAFTLYAFVAAGIWAHMMPALASKGQTASQALEVVVWFGPAQVLGRLAFLLLDRHYATSQATRAMGIVVLGSLAASLTVFALAESTWALRLFAVTFGISNGLVTIVRGGIVPEYFGRTEVGRISGTMSAISLVTRAFAPVLTAWALVALEGYGPMLAMLAGLGGLAVLSFAAARKPGRPNPV
ncbi:MAG: hypothetical protein RIS35_3262 [Pseudomonadota bacterium]|jgi:MFS family permease